jgi:hypothetical protein
MTPFPGISEVVVAVVSVRVVTVPVAERLMPMHVGMRPDLR